jgi:hypothetical protein
VIRHGASGWAVRLSRLAAVAFVACLPSGGNEIAMAAPKNHASADTIIAPIGKTEISGGTGPAELRAVITTHNVDIGKASDSPPDVPDTNCTYSRIPCSLVDRIDIFANGKPVFVPRSVFSDLADLDRGHFDHARHGRWTLEFDGGDADGAYTIGIVFDDHRVLTRKRSVGEFPENFETTTYVAAPALNN